MRVHLKCLIIKNQSKQRVKRKETVYGTFESMELHLIVIQLNDKKRREMPFDKRPYYSLSIITSYGLPLFIIHCSLLLSFIFTYYYDELGIKLFFKLYHMELEKGNNIYEQISFEKNHLLLGQMGCA